MLENNSIVPKFAIELAVMSSEMAGILNFKPHWKSLRPCNSAVAPF
jgi:hypothetical protein